MCGIAGFIWKNRKRADGAMIKKMTDVLLHRGPDAGGIFTENNLALGHRRLSILDLSKDGRQPMESADKNCVIVFNGEIYNYLELKEELAKKGAVFRTKTDTEVILESYRLWGADCVRRFNGMWAFALYDRRRGVLLLSRDRFGVKPLYVLDREDVFAFASEPKAILEVFPEERVEDRTQIWRFLKMYADNIDWHTFYRNIHAFAGSHNMMYMLSDNSMYKGKYWDIHYEENYHKWIDGRDPVGQFRAIFEDALKLRLRSDVPVGTSLSGGLDSSVIVGTISQRFGLKLKTFSSLYEDADCNEKEYIDCVNAFNGTEAHGVFPDKNEQMMEAFAEIVYHHDCPLLGASYYSGYSVSKEASKHVKVLIDGQGADELFGGYMSVFNPRLRDILDRQTFAARLRAVRMLAIFRREYPDKMNLISGDIVRSVYGTQSAVMWDKKQAGPSGRLYYDELLNPEFFDGVDRCIPAKDGDVRGYLNKDLYEQLFQDCIPNVLHHGDANSMNFSVEIRNPFLDYRLAEFAMALDGEYKVRNQYTKWIVRKACRDVLPEKVVYRTNKMGYPAPFARWLRESRQKEEMRETIFSLDRRGILKEGVIGKIYREHMEGIDRSTELFRFLTLELWYRICIENDRTAGRHAHG